MDYVTSWIFPGYFSSPDLNVDGGPCGILNSGNSCYRNVIFQCLSACPGYLEYLERLVSESENGEFLSADLLKVDLAGEQSRTVSAVPDSLTSFASPEVHTMEGRQQDAHEYFQKLMDTVLKQQHCGVQNKRIIDRTSHSSSNSTPRGLLDVLVYKNKLNVIAKPINGGGVTPRKAFNDHLMSPFMGVLVNSIHCWMCGYTGTMHNECFSSLSLFPPPPKLASVVQGGDGDSISIEQLIKRTFVLEKIDDFSCEKCKLFEALDAVNNDLQSLQDQISRGNGEKVAVLMQQKQRIRKALSSKDFSALSNNLKHVSSSSNEGSSVYRSSFICKYPNLLSVHINRSVFYHSAAQKNPYNIRIKETLTLKPNSFRHNVGSHLKSAISKSTYNIAATNFHQNSNNNSNDNELDDENQPLQTLMEAASKAKEIDDKLKKVHYKLNAFISHHGTHERGHFISYKQFNGRWFKISDHKVWPINDLQECLDEARSSVYMLFY